MWQFILTDLNGNVHGEITQGEERKINLPFMRVPSASFQIPLAHELAPKVLDTDCLLKCYRTRYDTGARELVFHGPVVTAEEVGEPSKQVVAASAAGPLWRLSKRLIPTSENDAGAKYGTEAVPRDLGLIAHDILTETNAVSRGFTGIAPGTHANSVAGFVGPWHLKNVAEAITELHAGINSFEFEVAPTEGVAYAQNGGTSWKRIGLLNIAPTIGTTRPNAVFEYGSIDGSSKPNVASYKRAVTRDGLINRAVVPATGWETTASVALVYSEDNTSIMARGLFEEALSLSGIEDANLRDIVADFHILFRKNPRQVITFQPVSDARPAPFVDYKVGDTVRARASVRGSLRFDAMFRIWGVNFTIDQNGSESVELELVMP